MALWLRPPSLCKLFIFLTCVVSSSGNMMGMDCWSLVFELNDCMSYMKDGSNEINPDPTCCLIVEILLKADVECICIKNSVQLGVKLDLTRALSLTSACNFSPTKCPLIVQTGSATPVITSSNVVKSLSTVTTTPDELEKVFSYSGEAKSLSTIAAAPDQNRERSLINVFTVVAPALAPNPVTVQKRHAASVFPYSNLFKSLSTIATTLDHLVSLTVQKEPATLVFPYSNAVKSLSTIAAAPYQTQEKSLISIKLEKSLTTRSLVDVFIIDAPALAPMPSLDDAPVPGGNNSHATLGLGLGLGIAISVIALVCIGIFFLRRRRRNNLNRLGLKSVVPPLGVNNDEPFASPAPLILNREPPNFEVVTIPPKNFKSERTAQPQYSSNPSYAKTSFMYDELALATNNFSDENLLGSGGFGNVHKGVLKDGTEVAVKKLKLGSRQGEREFQSEVETVSRVHHRHLVSLVGYCTSGTERLLVYEFVPNDTLEFHLHEKGRPPISWETRVKIALGSANGLAYLHEDCQPKIIHRDIKSSNILLDENFEAKVADFGLARFYLDVETHVSTRVMGTFGYLAPEYALTGKVTDKSDVFSFGVVLLELITGRRPIDKLQAYLDDNIIDWARPLLTQALEINNFDKLVDSRLPKDYNHVDMTRMVACASACVRHLARRRPSMNQVVCALEGIISLEDLNEGSKHGTISESH